MAIKLLAEFKQFALRGNVVDLAVGVIIGGAFGKVVSSVIDDLVMPPIGVLMGKGFTDSFVMLKPGKDGVTDFATLDAAKKAGAVVLSYGNFVTVVLNFVILLAAVFVMVKLMNRFKKEEDAAPPEPTPTETLLTEIRDTLQRQ